MLVAVDAMKSRVHKGVLELFDEYDGDFDLLSERWARESDRRKFSFDQQQILSQYVSQLKFSCVEALSASLRAEVQADLARLETFIDDDVVEILRDRILPKS